MTTTENTFEIPADAEKVAIEANVSDERHSEGVVYIKIFNPAERVRQGLKKLGMWWGISILCILIPVFHFVLVPLFFFLGIYFAHRSYKSEGVVLGGNTTCPHCHTVVTVKPAELQWPITEICQGCARVVRMERK